MKSLRSILGSALIVLGILFIIIFHTQISERLFSFSVGFRGISDSAYSYGKFISIRKENEGLKAELERLRKDTGVIQNKSVTEARVYSRFPANTRSLITTDRGSEGGIREGMAVFADVNQIVFVGRVLRVTRFQSEVQTFFDPEWKSSVLLEDKKLKALLVGGNPPHVDLIPKDSSVDAGEHITNASPEYPYGAFLGTLGEIEVGTNEIWQKAELHSAMFPDALDRVFIATEFP